MECKLQTTNVVEWCVTLYLFISLTHFAMQVTSLSYHAASGNIIIGLNDGHVEMWQTDPHIAPSATLRNAPQALPLPDHVCVRKRLAEAQAQVKIAEASIEKADSGLRQQISREQELKQSIVDLEAKCAYMQCVKFIL